MKESAIIVNPIVPVAEFEPNKYTVSVGEELQLTDKSKNDPNVWLWTVEGEAITTYDVQNPVISFSKPGIYSISLKASNEAGTNEVVREGLITVTAVPSGQGLNFDGADDYVEVANLFKSEALNAFTMEWWMYAKGNVAEGHTMGADASTILIQSSNAGSMKVNLGEKNVLNVSSTAEKPFIKQGEWIHVAMVFDAGRLTIYKNGAEVVSKKFSGMTAAPAWTNGFKLGTDNNKTLNAVMDEFRVWNVARSQMDIINTMNAPLVDPASQEGLELYYNFDQSGGNVKDALGKHEGIRKNFGPDGDAWTTSGAFNVGVDAKSILVTLDEANPSKAVVTFKPGIAKKRVVFVKKSSEAAASPVDEVKYDYVTNLNDATDVEKIANSGYICVYNGNKESVTIEGLSPLTTYDLLFVEYLEESRKPYYFATSSSASFTTADFTGEQLVNASAETQIYQTATDLYVMLPQDGMRHTVSLYTIEGVCLEKQLQANGEVIFSKAALTEGIYLIAIDGKKMVKVPVTK